MTKPLFAVVAASLVVVSTIVLVAIARGDAGRYEDAEADAEVLVAEAQKNYYVGVGACKECHRKNWATWRKENAHRQTFNKLNVKAKKNPKCLKCHSTGFGHPTGFKSLAETPKFANVGCESCHGPGGHHVELAKKKPDASKVKDWKVPAPDKESCVYCHKYHRHF